MLTRDEANDVVLMAANEMLACHEMLDAEGVPRRVEGRDGDGEPLSISQRLRLYIHGPSVNVHFVNFRRVP